MVEESGLCMVGVGVGISQSHCNELAQDAKLGPVSAESHRMVHRPHLDCGSCLCYSQILLYSILTLTVALQPGSFAGS